MKLFNQNTVYNDSIEDYDKTAANYYEKRLTVTGIVSRIGPDVWGVPSLELSD